MKTGKIERYIGDSFLVRCYFDEILVGTHIIFGRDNASRVLNKYLEA